MFSTEEFKAWGNTDAVLFAAVMTRIEGREHDALLRTYGFRGFPSMAILDADGNKLHDQIGRDLYSMQCVVRWVGPHAEMAAKVEAGEKVDEKQWLLARLYMGKIDAEEAAGCVAEHDLSDAERTAAESHLVVLSLGELMQKDFAWRRENRAMTGNSPDAIAAAYKMFKDGKRLPKGASTEDFYADLVVAAGEENEDAEAFFFGHARVEKRLAKEFENMTSMVSRYEEMAKTDDRYARAVDSIKGRIKSLEEQIASLKEAAAKFKK